MHQLRASYGMSVNRPEFREVSPSVYYDFDLASNVQGNIDLTACHVQNADLRYEFYPKGNRGEIEIDIDGSERHIERRIGRQEGVVAGVVVAPFYLFEEIETVGGIVVFDHELRGYVESAEVGREGVGGLGPVVVERACRIVACTVFTIDTDAELGVEPTCVEGLRVVESEGGDMLVEVGVFAGYVVGGRELEDPCLEGIVDEVAAPVGLVAIGVGITGVPAETDVIVLKQMGTSELGGICGTALVVVFRLLLLVVLGRYTHAGGVTLSPELVEDVFEFDTVFACTAGVTEVEHQAEAGVDSLLIVSGLT